MLAVGEQLLAALAVENELNRRLTGSPLIRSLTKTGRFATQRSNSSRLSIFTQLLLAGCCGEGSRANTVCPTMER